MSTIPHLPATISSVPIKAPFADQTTSGVSWPWIKWFQEVQRALGILVAMEVSEPPGPFVDDATAAAHGVIVGGMYYLPTGAVMIRLV